MEKLNTFFKVTLINSQDLNLDSSDSNGSSLNYIIKLLSFRYLCYWLDTSLLWFCYTFSKPFPSVSSAHSFNQPASNMCWILFYILGTLYPLKIHSMVNTPLFICLYLQNFFCSSSYIKWKKIFLHLSNIHFTLYQHNTT